MIQDIAPKVLDIEYTECSPDTGDMCFLFNGDNVFVKVSDNTLYIPTFGMVSSYAKEPQFLFAIDDVKYFMAKPDSLPRTYGYTYKPIKSLRLLSPKMNVFAAMTAYHLYTWYNNNTFCGKCGAKLTKDSNMRALNCTCGNQVFPTIAPAVIVAVTTQDSILLTRYKGRDYKGYALIAGFCEIGETLEDTVRREVMEEAGLELGRITYYKSQPWGVDSNLLVGFFARLKGDSTITLQEDELSFADWYRRDEIDVEPDDVSLTREMIIAFKRGYGG